MSISAEPVGPRIAVAPEQHQWYRSIVDVVRSAGAEVVDASDAEAIVWLGKHGDNLRDYLHPEIRWVQLHSAGVDYWYETGEIDGDRLFTSAKGAYSTSVAEHALALILAAARNLPICMRIGHWDQAVSEGRVLHGSSIALIGAGHIGRVLIDYLTPLSVYTIAVTRTGREVPRASESHSIDEIRTIWPRVDYAVVLAPLTEQTRKLVDRSALQAMPDHAWVINVARGSLVDTDALVAALLGKSIGGACLDVTDPEPLPDGHPLWSIDNALITPHTANPQSSKQLDFLSTFVFDNVKRFHAGNPLKGVVDHELGY